MSVKHIRIGTRGSPLAVKQTEMVRLELARFHPEVKTEPVIIRTSGDWSPSDGETRLSTEEGGKGQFAKEIEQALLEGEIAAAVHSMKDMESFLPEGLVIPCMLRREDPRDALLFSDDLREKLGSRTTLADLPEGAVVGTASVRRQSFLLSRRPDLKVVPLRGNVQTRIEKVRSGQVDVTMLAMAGLRRLDIAYEADAVLSVGDMLPAAGQGAIGIEIKESNDSILAIFGQINCLKTLLCVSAERAALAVLDGSCHTPIGAHATLEGDMMSLTVMVAALDGSEVYEEVQGRQVTTVEEAVQIGQSVGRSIKSLVPSYLFDQAVIE